jgi:SAM-dependent methyltransferase/uncharacterized protein YbaR (Trm112 family)
MSQIKISQGVRESIRCPVCHSGLDGVEAGFTCIDRQCQTYFPIVDGIPILISDRSSIFSIDDFTAHRQTFYKNESKLKKFVRNVIPNISKNIKSPANYQKMSQRLLQRSPQPRVLVIGGSALGEGMEHFVNNKAIDLVESDVSFGARTMLISDAHDLPFQDESFDGVIIQAVLEHVIDPYRCCTEIHRVLKDRGLVYAETPFVQQVHNSPYDFTRFTHLGHRRLFRHFEEIESGAGCGPGMALAWSYQYFLLSFTTSKILRRMLTIFARFTSFYLKYFDYYLIDKPGTLDAASGYYFMGMKSDRTLTDKDLIALYRGGGS